MTFEIFPSLFKNCLPQKWFWPNSWVLPNPHSLMSLKCLPESLFSLVLLPSLNWSTIPVRLLWVLPLLALTGRGHPGLSVKVPSSVSCSCSCLQTLSVNILLICPTLNQLARVGCVQLLACSYQRHHTHCFSKAGRVTAVTLAVK